MRVDCTLIGVPREARCLVCGLPVRDHDINCTSPIRWLKTILKHRLIEVIFA